MRCLPILPLLVLSGCMTSFRNSVTATFRPEGDSRPGLVSIVESIAREHELTFDSAASVQGTTMNFWGRPYHYYTFRIDTTDRGLVACFVHEARLTGKPDAGSEPEKAFFVAVNERLKHHVVEIEYHIDE